MAERRLVRSRSERRIAGVCGGIALWMETDPVFVRLAFVAGALIPPFSGIAVLGYLACWIVVPEEGAEGAAAGTGPAGAAPEGEEQGPHAAAPRPARAATSFPADASVAAGLLFIAAGVFFLLINLGVLHWDMFHFWRWRVMWPAAVILLGLFLVARALWPARRPPAGPAAGPDAA
ncbi:MAG TPA: PspC domain-containing protein [Candidatus Polarisedimenticolia bacterium]|nr:PspC domain-containing protein [Candidatus Polarisedimenticolia bacterium]